jgi:hypothetical protein
VYNPELLEIVKVTHPLSSLSLSLLLTAVHLQLCLNLDYDARPSFETIVAKLKAVKV